MRSARLTTTALYLTTTGVFEVRLIAQVLVICAVIALPAMAAEVLSPQLGQPASVADIARHNSMIFPDGEGLPTGRGGVVDGAKLY